MLWDFLRHADEKARESEQCSADQRAQLSTLYFIAEFAFARALDAAQGRTAPVLEQLRAEPAVGAAEFQMVLAPALHEEMFQLVSSLGGNVRRDLAAACVRAGIPAVTPNDLRRTSATWWRHHGIATHDIAALLGHRDSRMVERVYGRTDAQSLGRTLQRRLGLSDAPSPTRRAVLCQAPQA